MPWAGWVVAALLIAMEIPGVGLSVAYFFTVFSFLATDSVPGLVVRIVSGDASELSGSITVVSLGGRATSEREYLWGLFGWTGVVWLTTAGVLGVWIGNRKRAGGKAHGLLNLLVLVVGWPMCFWLAMYILATKTSG